MKILHPALLILSFIFMPLQGFQKGKWPKAEREAFIKSCIKNAKPI